MITKSVDSSGVQDVLTFECPTSTLAQSVHDVLVTCGDVVECCSFIEREGPIITIGSTRRDISALLESMREYCEFVQSADAISVGAA